MPAFQKGSGCHLTNWFRKLPSEFFFTIVTEKGDAVLIICIGALNEVLKFRYRHQRGVYAKDNTPVRSILGCFIKAGFEAAERSSFL